jgi:hypothetical protein
MPTDNFQKPLREGGTTRESFEPAAKAVLSEPVKIRNDFDFEGRLAVIEEMLEKITNPNRE